MEIRILLLFFLLTILTADVIAFPKGRGSRGSSRGSRRSSRGSRRFSRGSRVSSGGSPSRSSPSHIGSNSGHGSSPSWHKIRSSPTGTLSSQTVHHQNKDTFTSILPAKRRGARPLARPSGQSSASYGNAGLNDSSSFSHNSFEDSTLFTSWDPDDFSISNKLNERKKTKYFSNDEESDAVAAFPVEKFQSTFDRFDSFPTFPTSFLSHNNRYNNRYNNEPCQRMLDVVNQLESRDSTSAERLLGVDFSSTRKHFSKIKKALCD